MVAKDSLSLIERFLLAKNDQQNTFSDRRNSEKIEVHIYLAYISFFKCYNGNQWQLPTNKAETETDYLITTTLCCKSSIP